MHWQNLTMAIPDCRDIARSQPTTLPKNYYWMDYFQDHGIQRPKNNSNLVSNPNVEDFMSPTTARAYSTFEAIMMNSHRANPHEMAVLDSILSQLITENQSESSANPPAAKDFVVNLPTLAQVEDKSCNVCLDNLDKKESTVLPCNPKHFFHRECLVPWLEIHNTCPCCRFEFRTDDLEYEKRKRAERDALIAAQDSEEEWDPFYS